MNSTSEVQEERSQSKIQFAPFKSKTYSDYDSTALDFICMDKCMKLEMRLMKNKGKANSGNQSPEQLTLTI